LAEASSRPRRIAITGSTGLIGNHLVLALARMGHRITRVVRAPQSLAGAHQMVSWDPEAGQLAPEALEGYDAVINLSGANLAEARWSDERKRLLISSRVDTTALLVRTLSALQRPPGLLVQASAVGYYGHRPPDEPVDESGLPGEGFLAGLCMDWERAARPATEAGVRTVVLRTGLVLSPRGGMLPRMLPLFRKGFGGRLGSGRQVMSWITLEEIPLVVAHLLSRPDAHGPVNLVTPVALSNREFTETLARVLARPAVFPAPRFALKMIFGEMADEMILSGARVVPQQLIELGYRFREVNLESALRRMLAGEGAAPRPDGEAPSA